MRYNLDVLYKELFDAQLSKDWDLAFQIQKEIALEESRRGEGESPMAKNSEDVRNHEGAIR